MPDHDMKFDHIGVFVTSLELGRTHLAAILDIHEWTDPIDDPIQKVSVQFGLDSSGIRFELVAPNGEGNPVTPVLGSGKNILNHVAYTVPDLDKKLAELRAARCMPLGPAQPATAFDGRRIAFVLTPLRMIIELIE
ncbi:VOC family protein [Burkholderiaceae bacterium DAT-1]|nr:VOC family protein [Burkholderiaceae bacterium DAT-1]